MRAIYIAQDATVFEIIAAVYRQLEEKKLRDLWWGLTLGCEESFSEVARAAHLMELVLIPTAPEAL